MPMCAPPVGICSGRVPVVRTYVDGLRSLVEAARGLEQGSSYGQCRFADLWEQEERLWSAWTAELSAHAPAVRFLASGLRLPPPASLGMAQAP